MALSSVLYRFQLLLGYWKVDCPSPILLSCCPSQWIHRLVAFSLSFGSLTAGHITELHNQTAIPLFHRA